MTASYVCPDTATCKMQQICRDLITLKVNNQYVMWQKEFAITMIRHYHDHEIPFRIYRNCAHPDWEMMKRSHL